MDPIEDVNKFIDRELKDFFEAMESKPDLVVNVLRVHLITENMLERLILGSFKRGDRMIDKGGFSYSQKLTIIESLELLDDEFVQALRNLNAVRNDSAHQKAKQVSLADVDRIGRPLGKVFTRLRHDHQHDLSAYLTRVMAEVFRALLQAVAKIELQHLITEPPKQKALPAP